MSQSPTTQKWNRLIVFDLSYHISFSGHLSIPFGWDYNLWSALLSTNHCTGEINHNATNCILFDSKYVTDIMGTSMRQSPSTTWRSAECSWGYHSSANAQTVIEQGVNTHKTVHEAGAAIQFWYAVVSCTLSARAMLLQSSVTITSTATARAVMALAAKPPVQIKALIS